ncbi:MAG: hypothetical protein ABF778_06995 [Liquorilactobacillus hordei]|uniref:hypothetical protein n=1 Tax=Liquorilactobacillus hordei TaxID=468911 RepID=UPI0039ECB056
MNKFDRFETYLNRKSKMKKLLFDKYKNIFSLLCLIIILLVLGLLICFYKDVYKNHFFKFVFLNRQGDFQWVGLTALIAVISLTVTAWDNRRKFKADLISKSRIDWMKTVRNLLACYVTDVQKYMYMYYLFSVDKKTDKKTINDKLTEKMDDIKKDYYELKLFIPKNKSNQKVLRNIDLIWDELSYIGDYYDYGIPKGYFRDIKSHYVKMVDNYMSDLFDKTIEDGSKYFKEEWEKAKSGE